MKTFASSCAFAASIAFLPFTATANDREKLVPQTHMQLCQPKGDFLMATGSVLFDRLQKFLITSPMLKARQAKIEDNGYKFSTYDGAWSTSSWGDNMFKIEALKDGHYQLVMNTFNGCVNDNPRYLKEKDINVDNAAAMDLTKQYLKGTTKFLLPPDIASHEYRSDHALLLNVMIDLKYDLDTATAKNDLGLIEHSNQMIFFGIQAGQTKSPMVDAYENGDIGSTAFMHESFEHMIASPQLLKLASENKHTQNTFEISKDHVKTLSPSDFKRAAESLGFDFERNHLWITHPNMETVLKHVKDGTYLSGIKSKNDSDYKPPQPA